MRIGIDVDDVLADSLPHFLEAFNRRFGLQVPISQAAWEISRHHPEIPPGEIGAFFDELYRIDFLGSRPLLSGAKEGVEALSHAGHHLSIVTGRLRRDREITERWLEAVGLAPFFQEIADRDGVPALLHKCRVVETLALDLLLDDELHVALKVAELPLQVLLFDKPWNQGPLPKHVLRIPAWSCILSWLMEQEG
jgi:uncharacterized HAD superfamily protein